MINATPNVERDAWARLRFAVIGPLLASPPEGRELQCTPRQLAARVYFPPFDRHQIASPAATT